MLEKELELSFLEAAKRAGGWAPKFTSQGTDGMPDRILLMPRGRMAFVEVKAPGQKPRPLQLAIHRTLRALGFRVYVLDDPEDIPRIIDEVAHGIHAA